MDTISQLAKRFKLSRSTLLYYDRKNILKPSGRSDKNYRLYDETDCTRLQTICMLREVGVSILHITKILKEKESHLSLILHQRLIALNDEIHQRRQQQRLIAQLLGSEANLKFSRTLTKDQWVQLLISAGMDEEAMQKWHQEFEKTAPDAHQDFLESLGLNASEIKQIRTKYASSSA